MPKILRNIPESFKPSTKLESVQVYSLVENENCFGLFSVSEFFGHDFRDHLCFVQLLGRTPRLLASPLQLLHDTRMLRHNHLRMDSHRRQKTTKLRSKNPKTRTKTNNSRQKNQTNRTPQKTRRKKLTCFENPRVLSVNQLMY